MAATTSGPRSDQSPLSGPASERLAQAPGTLGSYGRAVLPLVPGASRLPFVAGRGSATPERELVLEGVRVDTAHLARYARVCGFRLGGTLPPTYPHVLAFGLHMDLMTRGDFPFAAIGLVHVENTITQHVPIPLGETLELRARTTQPEPHPKGKTFAFVTEARVDGALLWEERSTMLRRGPDGSDVRKRPAGRKAAELPARAQWTLAGRPRAQVRRGLGRPEPHPPHGADREALRLPGRDRPRHVDRRALPGGARGPAAGRVPQGGRLPPARPPAGPRDVREPGPGPDHDLRRARHKERGTPHLDGTVTPLKRGS